MTESKVRTQFSGAGLLQRLYDSRDSGRRRTVLKRIRQGVPDQGLNRLRESMSPQLVWFQDLRVWSVAENLLMVSVVHVWEPHSPGDCGLHENQFRESSNPLGGGGT